MKKQKVSNKLICVIIVIIIIFGIIAFAVNKFNFELDYSERQEITISSNSEFDTNKIEEIIKNVITDRKVEVRKEERFGNAVEIISSSISEEEKENIINKINEECGTNIENDNVSIEDFSRPSIKETVKPYILPVTITFVAIVIYFIVMYHKLGIKEIILKSVLVPLVTELIFYSVITIFRIPFGIYVISITIGLYALCILVLTCLFENKKKTITKANTENVGNN